VQGGAGHAGLHLVNSLCKGLKGNENFKITAGFTDYHEKNCPKLKECGTECFRFDLNEPDTFDRALNGVTCVIIYPPYLPNRDVLCNRFIDKCVQSGVKHVFLLSVPGAGSTSFNWAKQVHMIENRLLNSGMSYTIIRTALYQQSTLMQKKFIKEEGSFFLPSGDVKIPLVCLSDVGDLICKFVLNPELGNNKILDLTGPELLSGMDIARTFTAKLGKQVNFLKITNDQFKEKLKSCGYSDFKVESITELLDWYGKGNGRVSNEFKQIMGREPKTFETFVELKKDEILA